MSKLTSKRIPKVLESRLDETPSNSVVGYTRDDQWANAFIKKMEQNASTNGKIAA